ncbi:MAG: L,D-transpeptidase family protein [Verrucomicrobiota bacterium]|nr:L,D-transpeptidase family protein [Verrucomicrobiota bacterium]
MNFLRIIGVSFIGVILTLLSFHASAEPLVPAREGQQLIVSIAPDWDNMFGELRLFEYNKGKWIAQTERWKVIYGKAGMAWGLGMHPTEAGLQKKERDKRTPAGLFKIGPVYGAHPQNVSGAKGWPYVHVTHADAWVDDVASPYYNQYKTVDLKNPPPWFESQKMKPDDFAYEWRVLIEHNYPKAVPGAGSAIFFHIQRGETRPSAGCTVMPKPHLEEMIRWLNPKGSPILVQLPRDEYMKKATSWNLPPLVSFDK